MNNEINWLFTAAMLPFLGQVTFNIYGGINRRKYKMNRNLKLKNISELHIPPAIKVDYYLDEKKLKKKYQGNYLLRCANKLIKELPIDNLKFFYNNINTLKVKTKKFKLQKLFYNKSLAGEYNTLSNRISVRKDSCHFSMPHELLHMSSSYYDPSKCVKFSGFHQTCFSNYSIGYGLNEGYTQLLTKRYFDDCDVYVLEKHFASLLEKIIGKDIMENLYFNANLYGLFEELEKYATQNAIIRFLDSFDYINLYYKKDDNVEEAYSKIEYIANFFARCYLNKLKQEFQNNEIDIYTMCEQYSSFLNKAKF